MSRVKYNKFGLYGKTTSYDGQISKMSYIENVERKLSQKCEVKTRISDKIQKIAGKFSTLNPDQKKWFGIMKANFKKFNRLTERQENVLDTML